MSTKIEWVQNPDGTQGKTWNPVTGCTPVSEGCRNCYARRMARRLAGRYGYPEAPYEFDVTLHHDRLEMPLKRKKPTTYFVCSMSDLFHEEVPLWYINAAFETMSKAPQHTFQVLTKRPARMRWALERINPDCKRDHVWLGVSVEDQLTVEERVLILLRTLTAVRFVSCEPLLGPINLSKWIFIGPSDQGVGSGLIKTYSPLDWVIVGGESGPGARPMDPGWARGIRDQCQAAGVPFFFKSWGAWVCPTAGGCKDMPFPQYENAAAWDGRTGTVRVGKRRAGRLLDGREWNEMPNVPSRYTNYD